MVVNASTASSRDAQRLRRARRRPRRTTVLFHGMSRTTVIAATPCPMTTHRPDTEPLATAPIPVANAMRRATSRVRLVMRGGGARVIVAPGVVRARLCDIGLTSAHVRTCVISTVISYVIDHGKRGERFVT